MGGEEEIQSHQPQHPLLRVLRYLIAVSERAVDEEDVHGGAEAVRLLELEDVALELLLLRHSLLQVRLPKHHQEQEKVRNATAAEVRGKIELLGEERGEKRGKRCQEEGKKGRGHYEGRKVGTGLIR